MTVEINKGDILMFQMDGKQKPYLVIDEVSDKIGEHEGKPYPQLRSVDGSEPKEMTLKVFSKLAVNHNS